MLKIDVYLGDSEDPYETFFVNDENEIEYRIHGYEMLFGKNIKINYRISKEEGDAESYNNWGYE